MRTISSPALDAALAAWRAARQRLAERQREAIDEKDRGEGCPPGRSREATTLAAGRSPKVREEVVPPGCPIAAGAVRNGGSK